MWHLGTWVKGGFGSAGSMLGLDDLGGVGDCGVKEVEIRSSALPK